MNLFSIKKFSNPETLAQGFAKDLAHWVSAQKEMHIALSGGSTPRLLFQHLAADYAEKIDWTSVHWYWADERCVPPDHEQSNFKMANDLFLRPLAIPQENIHRIRGEEEPVEEAERYEQLLQYRLTQKNAWPRFDLILLGMGEDGHTASIFPHQMELLRTDRSCAPASHPKTRQQRVTLTGPLINNARRVVFLLSGASKQVVFTEILHHKGAWQTYPAAHIQPAGELFWYLDEAVLTGK